MFTVSDNESETSFSVSDACKASNPCDQQTQDCISVKDKAECVCKKDFLLTQNKKCQKNPCSINKGEQTPESLD